MLSIGDPAPDFALPDAKGAQVSLADLLRNGSCVVYFYPADATPVCTAEACMFRDRYSELRAAGISVAGISPQGTASKKKFAEARNLPFTLLADENGDVIRAWGARGLLGLPIPFGVRRVTYLVSPDRTIADRAVADLRVGPHAEFVQRVLEKRSNGGSGTLPA